MSLTQVFKGILDILWDLGGIGAAADLGLEHFDPAADCPMLAEGCPARCNCENIPLEDEPCRISCPSSGPGSGPVSGPSFGPHS